MRDTISIPRVAKLHPKVRDEAKAIIEQVETGFPPNMAIRVVQGLRTIEEQNSLYAIGRTTPGKKVTNARGGKSYHNYGLAIDFAIIRDKDGNGTFEELSWDTKADWDKDGLIDWQEVVKAFEAKGWEWGGKWRSFPDLPHVQKTFGYSVSQLFAKYKAGQYVNI